MRFTRILFWKAKDIVKESIPDVTKGVSEMTKRFSNLPESYIKRSMRQVQSMRRCPIIGNKLKNILCKMNFCDI